MTRAAQLPRPINPFAGSRSGRYQDDAVTVIRHRGPDQGAGAARWTAVTRHFAVGSEAGRLVVQHSLEPLLLDDLAALIADELFAPGWAGGADTFERILTGVVLSWDDDPLAAWTAFYAASLEQLDRRVDTGSTDGLIPVYRRAETLVRSAAPASLLDLGSCFGFFPLRVRAGRAGPGIAVTAADISAGTCALLKRVAPRLGPGAPGLPVLLCDAAAVPQPDGSVDTVTLLHVLEHVDADHGRRMLSEALRLARRQVIVAVPLETEPGAAYGHLRTVSLADLTAEGHRLAAGTSWRPRVEEHHGGWLVLSS